jgi:threonyl-tRNA synthetase
MLQRIYGTAYPKKSQLEAHLKRIEEAKERDHRKLGRELDLFSVQEEGGAGLVYWHPKGALIRELVEDFWRAKHRDSGYDIVMSPHIAKVDLWKASGHWDWYKDDMFSPMEVDNDEYLLKPMNCPFHILMYQTQTRSYRDLPLRWAELGTVYRYERSGVLHGMLRVRGFTQDDAHIFCRPDQLEAEIMEAVSLAQFMLESFGFDEYEIYLSVRDPENKEKFIGEDDGWERAEGALESALQKMELGYHVDVGEAKFYGPAIDIKYQDAIGREWQGPTIQCDFNLPERFDLAYIGQDGSEHRPVMIHRTVLGSMERFIGSLIEHYAGAFPVWLAPEQVRIIPITDDHHDYAGELEERFEQAGLRVHVDGRNEKVGYKIRQAELEKIPYMLVVGDREVEAGTVAVRTREEGDTGGQPVDEFVSDVVQEVANRSID